MYQYFLKEIDLKLIEPTKFDNNNSLFISKEKIHLFLTNYGFYKVEKNNTYKYKFYPKNVEKITNFLNKYTLYCNEINIKKQDADNIPFINLPITINKIEVKTNKYSKNSLIIEYIEQDIHDLYFLSNENHKNISLQEDISLFIEMLM